MRSPRLIASLTALVVVSIATGAATTDGNAAAAATVPAKYRQEYDQTAADLAAYARTIDAMPTYSTRAAGTQVGFAELLDANGNRMSALLKPSTMTHVNQSLDAFKRLGIGGVVLGVKLPLLLSQYTSQAGQYTQFWVKVANAARAAASSSTSSWARSSAARSTRSARTSIPRPRPVGLT